MEALNGKRVFDLAMLVEKDVLARDFELVVCWFKHVSEGKSDWQAIADEVGIKSWSAANKRVERTLSRYGLKIPHITSIARQKAAEKAKAQKGVTRRAVAKGRVTKVRFPKSGVAKRGTRRVLSPPRSS